MTTERHSFAVRLLGFAPEAAHALAQGLQRAPQDGPAYLCLQEDSLQDPDLYLANGADLKALAAIETLAAGGARPALVLGAANVAVPYPTLPLPVQWRAMYAELARLAAQRTAWLAALSAAGRAPAPERRHRERLDLDLTDPTVYQKMRRPRRAGAVLCVDANPAFCEQLGKVMAPFDTEVAWAVDGVAALAICRRRPVAVVLLDFAAPIIDHYLLCAQLRSEDGQGAPPDVVFLLGAGNAYDSTRARAAGAAGLLDKPVAGQQALAVLRRLMRLD